MALVTTYEPLPIYFTHGKGVWLYDKKGKAYLDSFSGIAVCGLGHAHPDVTRTLQEQAAKLIHTSNAFLIEEQLHLAEKLTSITHMQQVFFANSGAEANEAAIKLARLYGHKKGIEAPAMIVMQDAFHGRSLATLSASGSRKAQAGYEPLVPGFIRAPFNDIDALRNIAAHRDDVVAVMLEPIQGEGGIRVAEESYLRALADLCKEQDWLLILDEVQTGNGRTGQWYAFMDYKIQPDIITTAKGLGNGMPISACLMHNKACDLFKPGNHGSTFGGNPLATATALTVLQVIERDKLCQQVAQRSLILRQRLLDEYTENPHVRGIRGKGYMLGIELDKPAQDLKKIALKNGLLLNITAESVIRILPPLIINEDETDEMLNKLRLSLADFYKKT
jgi:acetylornithine/N-succinyldiaminopimelate aminotransferase